MDKISTYIFGLGILVIISIAFTTWSTIRTDNQFDDISSTLASINNSLELESENHFINIISSIQPSIVTVLSAPAHKDNGSNNIIFLDNNGQEWNLGAGFSIDDNGDILTANHVITGATETAIILNNGTLIPVSKASSIPDLDVAILYVNSSVPSVKLQDGISSQIGMSIAFTGFPLSTSIEGGNIPVKTTVKGSISAVIPFTYNNLPAPVYILGAAANKGNSGGPVFSLKTGEVVGIINQKITEKEGVTISTVVNQQLINSILNRPFSTK